MGLKKVILVFIVPFLFFITSFLTLSDYGISWDEPIHFQRGQAYLYYFLTGETTYKNLPLMPDYYYFSSGETTHKNLPLVPGYIPKIEGVDIRSYTERQIPSVKRGILRSYFQNESLNGEYFMNNDSGHPPLNGILAALFNKIFYQDLGILGDIESHHLFIVFSASILVLVVSIFTYQTYGLFASLIASICLSLYPLFFAESHFNIKDPPETAFIGLTIWTFWESLNKKSWKWLITSALAFSLALGTKFNVLFLPFIILPYMFVRYFQSLNKFRKIPVSYLIALFLSPFIIALVFFGTWPYLWQDLLTNTISIFKFYKDLGTGAVYQQAYLLPSGFNVYPIYWIITTTPVWILILTLLGIWFAVKNINKKQSVTLLWLLWFFVPILRVSLPHTALYGGVRQIMEYVPAMALLAGLGAYYLVTKIKMRSNKLLMKTCFFLVSCLLLLVPVVKYHPNENVYFNFLVGGLSGAHEREIPSNGNSFGNAYYQAAGWINENVEEGAKVSLLQGTLTNIPVIYLRPDIKLWNGYWSGINREGEYLVELTYQGVEVAYQYAWDYVDKFLDPVYEVKVDGVAVAKVWKNDLAHTKPEFAREEKLFTGKIDLRREPQVLLIELSQEVPLSHFSLTFNNKDNCSLNLASVAISLDGKTWTDKIEQFLSYQINAKITLDGNTTNYYFPSDRAKYIKIRTNDANSCLLNVDKFNVTIL